MSVLPLYHRIFLALRDQIVNGVYDYREPMPGENKLCVEFNVSRATVRRALALLEEEGLVERRQGARTYAKALGYKTSQQRGNLDLLGRSKSHLELLAGDISQNYEIVAPKKQLWRQFGKPEKLGRVERVRQSRGKPYCFVVTYMPMEIASRISWAKLGSKPVITAVLEAGYDFVKVEQTITATVADDASAAAMQAPVGSPLLCVSGLFVDVDGNAVMRKDGYFHPDSFEYSMTLYRDDAQ